MPPVIGSGRKAGWQRAEFDSIFVEGILQGSSAKISVSIVEMK